MTIIDSSSGFEPKTAEDKGIEARDKLNARRAALRRAARLMVGMVVMTILVAITMVSALGYMLYLDRKSGYDVSWRHCGFKDDTFEIEGSRRYGTPFMVLGDFKFNQQTLVEEKTYLKTKGEKVRIVAMTGDDKPVLTDIKVGDAGDKHELPKADKYVFIYDKDIAVVTYDQFCK